MSVTRIQIIVTNSSWVKPQVYEVKTSSISGVWPRWIEQQTLYAGLYPDCLQEIQGTKKLDPAGPCPTCGYSTLAAGRVMGRNFLTCSGCAGSWDL